MAIMIMKSAVLIKTHPSVKYFLICDQLEIYIVCGKEQNIPVEIENINFDFTTIFFTSSVSQLLYVHF